MRPREEILKDQWKSSLSEHVHLGEGTRILEVLLDIRDLLFFLTEKK